MPWKLNANIHFLCRAKLGSFEFHRVFFSVCQSGLSICHSCKVLHNWFLFALLLLFRHSNLCCWGRFRGFLRNCFLVELLCIWFMCFYWPIFSPCPVTCHIFRLIFLLISHFFYRSRSRSHRKGKLNDCQRLFNGVEIGSFFSPCTPSLFISIFSFSISFSKCLSDALSIV